MKMGIMKRMKQEHYSLLEHGLDASKSLADLRQVVHTAHNRISWWYLSDIISGYETEQMRKQLNSRIGEVEEKLKDEMEELHPTEMYSRGQRGELLVNYEALQNANTETLIRTRRRLDAIGSLRGTGSTARYYRRLRPICTFNFAEGYRDLHQNPEDVRFLANAIGEIVGKRKMEELREQ